MEIIHLLIVSTISGSTPFAEGSAFLGGCIPFGMKYHRLLKQSFTSGRTPSTSSNNFPDLVSGMKFDPLEILEDRGANDIYPNCNSIKAVEFSSDDDGVQVTLLKLTWMNEIVVDGPGKTVTVWYKMSIGSSFILDVLNFPTRPGDFGLHRLIRSNSFEDMQSNIDQNHDILTSFADIRNSMSTNFQFSVVFMSQTKRYAIFRILDSQCTWIGWNAQNVQSTKLTPKIINKLQKYNISYKDHWSQNEGSQPEMDQFSVRTQENINRLSRSNINNRRNRSQDMISQQGQRSIISDNEFEDTIESEAESEHEDYTKI